MSQRDAPRFAHDFENDARASEGFDFEAVDALLEPDEREAAERDGLIRVILWVRGQKRKAYAIDCLFLAMGSEALLGLKMWQVARRHGVSTAAVSKKVKGIQTQLRLPRNRNNKPAAACLTYARLNYRPTAGGGID